MWARITTTAVLLSYIQASLAQQSVLSIPFYGYDNQSVVASVVSADSTATTLQLACPSGTDGNDCGLFPYQTLTIGPNTYHMDMSGDGFTGTQDCVSTTICAESAGGSGANFPGASTTTYEVDDIETLPVTVTSGAAQLTAAAGSAATTTSAGSTSASAGSASSTSATAKLTTLVGGQNTASQTGQSTTPSATDAVASGTSTGAAAFGARAPVGIVAAVMGVVGMFA